MEQSERADLGQFRFTEVNLKCVNIVPPFHINIGRYLTQSSMTAEGPLTTIHVYSGFVRTFFTESRGS
jgi:hypothetical protein